MTDRQTAGRKGSGEGGDGQTEAAEVSLERAVCVLFVCPLLGRACLLSAALLSPKTVSHTHIHVACVYGNVEQLSIITHMSMCVCVCVCFGLFIESCVTNTQQ